MMNESGPIETAIKNGGTIKIEKHTGESYDWKRGDMEAMNRACNRFFRSRNIEIKDLRQIRTEELNKRREQEELDRIKK